jgi:ferredoxin
VPECDAQAIYQEDEVPEDQQIYIELNAELAELWPVQTEVKPAMDEAEKWNGVPDKLGMLEK